MANDYAVLEVFVDAGISGSRADNRPGLQRAIVKACQAKAALVVYSLSRLARSTKDTIAIGERLSRSGADLVSLCEKIDTTSAAGKMIFRMLAVLAEFERDQISERTRMALAHKAMRGQRVGTVPYGWELENGTSDLQTLASEQMTIAKIQELRNAGMSFRAIASQLTLDGIPTKNGSSRWCHTTIKSILCRSNKPEFAKLN